MSTDLVDTTNSKEASVPASNIVLNPESNDTDLTYVSRGISFGTAGALKVTTAGGQTVTIPSGALAAGVIHPLRLTRVFDTGTDAADIVVYY